jgi:hypothetical protein
MSYEIGQLWYSTNQNLLIILDFEDVNGYKNCIWFWSCLDGRKYRTIQECAKEVFLKLAY